MDAETYRHFVAHVRLLEVMAIAGDETSGKSLACIALLAQNNPPNPPGDGEIDVSRIIDFAPYLKLVA